MRVHAASAPVDAVVGQTVVQRNLYTKGLGIKDLGFRVNCLGI